VDGTLHKAMHSPKLTCENELTQIVNLEMGTIYTKRLSYSVKPSSKTFQRLLGVYKWCHLPSKLPKSTANCSRALYVSIDGRNTNTPELKQSGQPASGAADSSSRSNSSSTFLITCRRQHRPGQIRKLCVHSNVVLSEYLQRNRKSVAPNFWYSGHKWLVNIW